MSIELQVLAHRDASHCFVRMLASKVCNEQSSDEGEKTGQAPQLDLESAKQFKSLWPNMQHKLLTLIKLFLCINSWICLASICRGNQTIAKVKGGVSHQIWILLEADCNGSCLLMQHTQAQRDILVMLPPFDLVTHRA